MPRFLALLNSVSRLALVCALTAALPPAPAHAQFVDISSLLPNGYDGSGASWGDLDNDGRLEIFVPRYFGCCDYAAISDHRHFWIDLQDTLIDNHQMAGAWGDYDNDGDVDLFVTNSGPYPNKLFRNNDNGSTFTDVTSQPLRETGYSESVSWADFDMDGDLDLLVVRHTEPTSNLLYRNDAGTFVNVSSSLPNNLGGRGAAWGDYDNDGDPDLYVASMNADVLYRNNGGTFVNATQGDLAPNGRDFGVAWGDYDNDGDLDLFRTTAVTGSKLFRNDGGTFVNVTSGPMGEPGGGSPAWGDYDNDRDLDLFLAQSGSANRLFRNDGGTFVNVTTSPLGSSVFKGAAWADNDPDPPAFRDTASSNGRRPARSYPRAMALDQKGPRTWLS